MQEHASGRAPDTAPGSPDGPDAQKAEDSPITAQVAVDEDGSWENRVRRAARAAASGAPLRAVFMGTPAFAATILEHLRGCPDVRIEAVYCQPDRAAGRGQKPRMPEVKALALKHGLPVLQPPSFRAGPEGDAAVAELRAFAPDLLLVAAYGLILPQRVLDIPRLMPVNVHASLLPRLRGAAPVQRAIMNGDLVTGVSIMRMEASLDTGPILLQRAVGIGLGDTAATLMEELAREGADLLVAALERLRAGALRAMPQNGERATWAPRLRKEEGQVDFSRSCREVHALIRGVTPWPGAGATLLRPGREPVPVLLEPGPWPLPPALADKAGILCAEPALASCQPGAIAGLEGDFLLVGCADGLYALPALRPAGKKSMTGRAFFHGYLGRSRDAAFAPARPERSGAGDDA